MPGDLAVRVRMVGGAAPVLWYRDPISCLQSTFAAVLARAGEDPLAVLGAGWRFHYLPGDVRSEEFYYPCPDGDLGAVLAPHHALNSRWWRPADTDDPLRELRAALEADRLVIAAVDNFHLPFRPAFGDVHAAHLLIVYGLDEYRGVVHVSDAQPPAYRGPIPLDAFLRSWGSANPADEQDAFFSASAIGRRCLDVEVAGPYPEMSPELLAGFLHANAAEFARPADASQNAQTGRAEHHGLSGLEYFTTQLVERARAGEAEALSELYAFGWGMQAQSALHGELLRTLGRAWGDPALAGAGRAVEAVAHGWTGLRMTGAHGLDDPKAAAADLARHAGALRRRYEEALDAVNDAADR